MLQLTNFRKTYHSQPVLQIDFLSITSGIYWVQGVNGSGKSTLLKALAGIVCFGGDSVLNGQISLKRHSVAYRRLVNFAEAEPVFPEFLTGTELLNLFEVAKQAPDQQADYFLESMLMTGYINDPIRTYSSGMLKKLSLVLAFLGRPACILLDEPLTTLDVDSLPILHAWIAEQHLQQGTTILLSSHQPLEGTTLPTIQNIVVEHQTIRYAP